MIDLTPLWHKLLLTLRKGAADLGSTASSVKTICPPEATTTPPAMYLEGDLDKVLAFQEDTNREFEMTRLRGGQRNHEATTAYTLTDVKFLPSGLYKNAFRYMVRQIQDPLIGLPHKENVKDAALSCTYYGSIYFGHWMTDDLTLSLIEDFGETLIASRKVYGHEPQYRELFQLQQYRQTSYAHCERITIFDDRGQNSFKRERYRMLRTRLRKAAPSRGNQRVFIKRGSSGSSRTITNSDEVEQYLRLQGFVIVDPEKKPPRELAELIGGAHLILGVEGSHLIHGIFNVADDGVVCTLQPPDRFNNVLKDYTDCLHLRYAFLLGDPAQQGFVINIDRLKRLLDQL